MTPDERFDKNYTPDPVIMTRNKKEFFSGLDKLDRIYLQYLNMIINDLRESCDKNRIDYINIIKIISKCKDCKIEKSAVENHALYTYFTYKKVKFDIWMDHTDPGTGNAIACELVNNKDLSCFFIDKVEDFLHDLEEFYKNI